jgi:photosystem II stability/assembly factor-like uncharacterized protein
MQFKSILFVLSLCTITTTHAQQKWMEMVGKTSNFYDIKAAFLKENEAKLKSYYQNLRQKDNEPRDETIQAEHEAEEYQDIIHFMRIAEWVEPRVSETNGDMDALIERDYRARLALMQDATKRSAANWTVVGPLSTNSMVGNGRVNSIKIDPNSATTFYACTPAGQLWKSTNSGGSWAVISDGIPAVGVTNVAIDPTDSNILYALTGDADQAIYHPSSRGVYKSTNGGATWAATGINYTSNGVLLTSILIHPTTPSIVLVSGTSGIFRSTNGGTTFTSVSSSSIRELVFNPQNPSTVFAASKTGAVLLRSYNAGVTWTQITSGVPTTATAVRFSIDVSPVDTNYVFLMATNSSSNLEGFYRSTDGGSTFTLMSSTATTPAAPNIPNGQGWYNLAVAADPTSANAVYAAGLSIYRSTDGGATFTNISVPHVDVHDLQMLGTDLLASSDGGVYRRIGTTWSNISSNLAIAQPYGIGLSPTNANMMVTGHQDNGTNLTTDGLTWRNISGGDGMIAFIDRTNTNNIFMTYQNGVLRRSTNGGTNSSTLRQVPNGYWVTPFIQDPQVATTIYAGGFNVYRSQDNGTTWDSISNFGITLQIRWMDVCRTNNQIIYFTTSNAIYKTTDGGANWTNVTGTVPTTTHLCIHIDVNNPNTVYVTTASSSGNAVYVTTDAGATWANLSAGLPNSAANTIVTQIGLSGVAYCGTDIGVYYRNPSVSASWQPFSTGLPVVPVRDLEIHYGSGKIRAGTFGRSVWESPLDQIVIPVELLDFQAQRMTDGTSRENREGVSLTWQTASEVRFNHFEIERSGDGKSWQKLKEQTAKGSASSYETLDEKPLLGVNYYRLKMVDNDGSYNYSKTISIDWNKPSTKQWTLFPNPLKDKLFLAGNEDVSGEKAVQILDISGKVLIKTTVNQVRNGLTVKDLPNGSYFLEINNDTTNEKKSFVVEK